MFVDREKELKSLEESYKFFLSGHSRGVLVYGYRKVGKTRLVEKFIERKKGIIIDLSTARSVRLLCRLIVSKLSTLTPLSVRCDVPDTLDAFVDVISLPVRIVEKLETNIVVALDEFHIPIEKISAKIARKSGERKERVISDMLWAIRHAIYSTRKIFWIFISSIGWKKIQEYISKKYGAPLTGVLDTLRVDPLPQCHSIELAKFLTRNEEIAVDIANVSGGIPRIIEILSRRYNTTKESISKLTINAIYEGELDEIFDNMIRAIADISRRDYGILLQTLKCVAENMSTPDKVALCLDTSRDTAYACLEELHILGLLEKEKKGKFVSYYLKYPLLGEWLKIRIEPRKDKTEILASALGITAESYIRELLTEIINKKIEIQDDKNGTFLAGTVDKIALEITKVLSREETRKMLKGTKNADIVAETRLGLYIIEVKAKSKPIEPKTIRKLAQIAKHIHKKTQRKTAPVLITLIKTEIPPTTIAEAIKNNVIIITSEGIRQIAKKIKFPHW